MSGKILLYAVILSALLIQYGCAGKLYSMMSQPSLSEASRFGPTKVYGYSELLGGRRDPMKVADVEITTIYLLNSKSLRSYDISFVVPIPETIQEGTGIGEIGRLPFNIFLGLRADGYGATFKPLASELYLESSSESIKPSKIILVTHPKYTLWSDPPSYASRRLANVEEEIPLLNKQNVMTSKGEEIKDWTILHETPLQFQFNIPTPDPSEKFHLKLGEIVTPSGESIRPTIYFTPVNVVEIVH